MYYEIDKSGIFKKNGVHALFPRDGNHRPSAAVMGYDADGVAHLLEVNTEGRLVVDTSGGSARLPTTFEIEIAGEDYTIFGVVIHTSSTGSGVVPLSLSGKITGIGIVPPSDDATCTLQLDDEDGFIRFGPVNLVGTATVLTTLKLYGTCNLLFTGATNGVYKIKIWYE